jgi:hypothetical protein
MLPAIYGHDARFLPPEDDGLEVVCADCRSTLSADDAGVLLGVERCPECERKAALRLLLGCEFLHRPAAERIEILTAAQAALHHLEAEIRSTLRRRAAAGEVAKCASCKCMEIDPNHAPCCSGACREQWDTDQRLVQLKARAEKGA